MKRIDVQKLEQIGKSQSWARMCQNFVKIGMTLLLGGVILVIALRMIGAESAPLFSLLGVIAVFGMALTVTGCVGVYDAKQAIASYNPDIPEGE